MSAQGALLVGSVPLADASAVFRLAGAKLGRHLRRIPDGETGERKNWIAWQLNVFQSMLEFDSEVVDIGYIKRAKFRLKAGVRAEQVRFPVLGYARAALESYAEFARLRQSGDIPSHLRFQVCLPTPIAPVTAYVFPDSQAAIEPRYEAQLFAELDEILAAIPHERLALQWDTAIEFAILEGIMPTFYTGPESDILERLVRFGNRVPAEVELGYHLCYGDSGHKHFKEPGDMAKLVAVSNHLARRLSRHLNWIHMPVPRTRADDAYFAPLGDLQLRPGTELYLGLVHYSDGAEGAKKRIETATKFVKDFGVATECGFGRRQPETIPALLELHGAVCTHRENLDA